MLTALVTRLASDAGVSAYVDDRVSVAERNEGEGLPALVITKVSPGRDYHHRGADSLFEPMVQFDCYAVSYSEARMLADEVIGAIEPAAFVNGVSFGQSFLRADRDMTPPADKAGGARIYRISLDFNIFYKE